MNKSIQSSRRNKETERSLGSEFGELHKANTVDEPYELEDGYHGDSSLHHGKGYPAAPTNVESFEEAPAHHPAKTTKFGTSAKPTKASSGVPPQYEEEEKFAAPSQKLEDFVTKAELPEGAEQMPDCLRTLLNAETNIHFIYPLLTQPNGSAALALCVEDDSFGGSILSKAGFKVLRQEDLSR